MNHNICIIGLGYVGLPLAIEFGKKYKTIGFDINSERIQELKSNIDLTGEVSEKELRKTNILFVSSKEEISNSNTYIVTVPTPINKKKEPNLNPLKKASELVGELINKDDLVIFESTVYPGCTLEVCVPIIESVSGFKLNEDFICGYSPERINPGDKEKTLTKIDKIISGSNLLAKEMVDNLYTSILKDAKTFPASSIMVAEAAKVIENAQRDLNIAFVNELAIIFEKMNLNTNEVLDAASSKWNFLPFRPGLVGGHCIGVDPYYLTYKSESLGYSPQFILSGRKLNDNMGKYIAKRVFKLMDDKNIELEGSNILVLGITFKENCPDVRNTKVIDIINEFKNKKVNVDVYDPYADSNKTYHEYGVQKIDNYKSKKYNVVVLAVAHDDFQKIDLADITHSDSIIFDVKNFFPNNKDRVIHRL
ncbi:MAG: Vi polysaccharide biosynthesis protein VipA/TviB [Candidatus Marinimicrobia bacterium]|nr:Vi polysaccharide biosynthesis protein VipA/TviB [Candidatus Neomarinimicrobiota bacterium]